jgi:hypothetical protein
MMSEADDKVTHAEHEKSIDGLQGRIDEHTRRFDALDERTGRIEDHMNMLVREVQDVRKHFFCDGCTKWATGLPISVRGCRR